MSTGIFSRSFNLPPALLSSTRSCAVVVCSLMTISSRRKVWFALIDGDGELLEGTSASMVSIPADDSVVDVFRDAALAKHPNALAGIDSSALTVYRSLALFKTNRANHLEEDDSIDDPLGINKANALAVLVRTRRSQQQLEPLSSGGGATLHPSKRPKSLWKVTSSSVPLTAAPRGNFLSIAKQSISPATGLDELDEQQNSLVLYRRELFQKQLDFLGQRVVKASRLGRIYGLPGTGKSSATFAFVGMLDSREWVVTWLHVMREGRLSAVRLVDGVSSTLQLGHLADNGDLEAILMMEGLEEEHKHQKKHFVILDGYMAGGKKHDVIYSECSLWFDGDSEKRRLVVVSSMAALGKVKAQDDKLQRIEYFCVYSWRLEEYLEAVKDDSFWENVKHNIDSSFASESLAVLPGSSTEAMAGAYAADVENRLELVRSKFYFAGGSSRFMFSTKTSDVVAQIIASVDRVSNVIPYMQGTIGDISDAAINRLFNRYFFADYETPRVSIVSQFAALRLAVKGGPELVRNMAATARSLMNPYMDGWLLEMWFFAQLSKGGVKLMSQGGAELPLPEDTPHYFDPNCIGPLRLPSSATSSSFWLKPVKWNQGGYDGVFVDKDTGLVRFIQVTRSDKHSFKLRYFRQLLVKLADTMIINKLEVYFIVPEDKRVSFRVTPSQVEGQGLLQEYQWNKCHEHDLLEIWGLRGWNG